MRQLFGLLFVALLLAWTSACGEPPSASRPDLQVHAEPTRLIFHPDTAELPMTVVNRGEAPVAVSEFRIEGTDWESFSIVDPLNPVVLAPGEAMTFHVGVDADSLLGPDPDKKPPPPEGKEQPAQPEVAQDEYREASATLKYSAGGVTASALLTFEEPEWLFQFVVPAAVKILALVMLFIMPLASLLTWMERKQSAMMQDRIGPNMARISLGPITLRLWGLIHVATDGIKMLFKEDFVPRHAHRILYGLAPILSFVPALVVFAIVPFGDAICYGEFTTVLSQADVDQCAAGRGGTPLQIAQIDVGLLYYFAIASLATYGTTLAGWASYNKWAVLGALRASAQMISYEVAIGLTIVGALLVYGTLEPHALVKAQLVTHWGILLQPVAFILFFTAAIAETKRAPFDLPEGESEIIGYFIEYSGMRFGLFFLGEFIEVVFVGALVTTLFLGGWSLPFGVFGASGFESPLWAGITFGTAGLLFAATGAAIFRAAKHAQPVGGLIVVAGAAALGAAGFVAATGWGTQLPHIAVVAVGLLIWGVKVLAICWLQLLIRWTLPRFRYDQLMSLGWKGLLPLSIANIVVTAVVVYALAGVSTSDPEPVRQPDAKAAQEVKS